MFKKILMSVIIFVILVGILSIFSNVFAITGNEVLNSTQATELVEMKESAKGKLAEYIEKYGSNTYGVVAYVLNAIRIYSIPFCFIGIAISSVFQFVLGIRKLDVRDKGFKLMYVFITIGLICQVLPLIFAIVVNGWRG